MLLYEFTALFVHYDHAQELVEGVDGKGMHGQAFVQRLCYPGQGAVLDDLWDLGRIVVADSAKESYKGVLKP